ncbi:MAG: hypothetical protein H0T46_30315 [Deltaproteobacteria bacterium]|nr:hypothetical protein [Deltaproteobacteria bacterium]
MRTRHSFAAPFVLVGACGSSGGTSIELTTSPAATIAAPADAAIDAREVVGEAADPSIDARLEPPTRGKDPPPYFDPCAGPPGPRSVTCNPPPPTDLEARIVEARTFDGGLTILVDRGADEGINKRWKVVLVGPDGKSLPAERGEITMIRANATKVRFSNRTELPPRVTRVRLRPP